MNSNPNDGGAPATGDSKEDLTELLDAVYTALDDDPSAARSLLASVSPELAAHPDLRLVEAAVALAVDGEAKARALLESLVAEHPDDADARHALAGVYEALDERDAMIEQYLRVRELDVRLDRAFGFDAAEESGIILAAAQRVVEGLPAQFRERLKRVPIVIEARPSRALVELGFDPRALGLFEGADHRERFWDAETLPPRIVLYSANLTAGFEPDDPSAIEREVEITVLHEVGHYFGLDEDDLDALGLG